MHQVKCPFMGNCPQDIDCNCKGCYRDWLNDYDEKEDELEWDKYWGFQKPYFYKALEKEEMYHIFQLFYRPQDCPPLPTPSKRKTSKSKPEPQILMMSSTSSSPKYISPPNLLFKKDNLTHAQKVPYVIRPEGAQVSAQHAILITSRKQVADHPF